ncbi:hypothetical protein SIAM614_00407 [Stappia aggregata IAM 12614]|uniref:Uncharacterized protein n=1 Tax=Roseibium aggregatum (strain ATCC 25650 / DSM 13394 / JCM 20685 / NBRC 16684 / NCIMB 2208 / IAM 12614 / B1) TaxID=384765 RepID=A0P2K4_ROSAI|nr:hypothetical protein SIAM614_00407 [Stappia aggregata IAM 12614] [Roseibium aggregatum IAM 12614]
MVAGALDFYLEAAPENGAAVADETILKQRTVLAATTVGRGFGPQSPRDIDNRWGNNRRVFSTVPDRSRMTLCDIHFHKNAEHRGGDFTTFAGNGDGRGYGTGFLYDGRLSAAELAPRQRPVGSNTGDELIPGDTIEIHFVFSTIKATLGNGLGTCLSETIGNPQLRVEAVVAVLVNDPGAADLVKMARVENHGGLNQVPNLPMDLGVPVVYAGSTTGPAYNEKGSPFQVTWSVRPRVVKLDIASLDAWLANNPFKETRAHGVRNLVRNPDLLSEID